MHNVTENGDLTVLIKDVLGNTCYLNRLHMLDLMSNFCLLRVVSGPINILRHYDIPSQDWKVFQDVIIDCMKDSLYRMTTDVLKLPCTISLFYIVEGVSFILALHLWYWGIQVVHHDVRVLVL